MKLPVNRFGCRIADARSEAQRELRVRRFYDNGLVVVDASHLSASHDYLARAPHLRIAASTSDQHDETLINSPSSCLIADRNPHSYSLARRRPIHARSRGSLQGLVRMSAHKRPIHLEAKSHPRIPIPEPPSNTVEKRNMARHRVERLCMVSSMEGGTRGNDGSYSRWWGAG